MLTFTIADAEKTERCIAVFSGKLTADTTENRRLTGRNTQNRVNALLTGARLRQRSQLVTSIQLNELDQINQLQTNVHRDNAGSMIIARIDVQSETSAQTLCLRILGNTAAKTAGKIRANAGHIRNVLARTKDNRRSGKGAQLNILLHRRITDTGQEVDCSGNRNDPVDPEDITKIGIHSIRGKSKNPIAELAICSTSRSTAAATWNIRRARKTRRADAATATRASTGRNVRANAEIQSRPVETSFGALGHRHGYESHLQSHLGHITRHALQIRLDDLVVCARRR